MTEAVCFMGDSREKVAILMWDEMSLSTHVDYDTSSDKIAGVEEWNLEYRSEKIGKRIIHLARELFLVK